MALTRNHKIFVLIVFAAFIVFRLIESAAPNRRYGKVFYKFGLRQEEKGNLAKAAGYYEKAVSSNPDIQDAYYRLSVVKFKQGDYDRSVESAQRAVNMYSEFDEAYNMMGLAYNKKGQFADALAAFKKALEFGPFADKNYLYNAAIAHIGVGDRAGALDRIENLKVIGQEAMAKELAILMKNSENFGKK